MLQEMVRRAVARNREDIVIGAAVIVVPQIDFAQIDGVFQDIQPIRADTGPERAFEYPLFRIRGKQSLGQSEA